MIDLSPELATLLLFGLLLLFMTTGFPLALVLGGVAMLVGLLGKGVGIFDVFYLRAFSVVTEFTFLAIPLFVFMAIMVETVRGFGKALQHPVHSDGPDPGKPGDRHHSDRNGSRSHHGDFFSRRGHAGTRRPAAHDGSGVSEGDFLRGHLRFRVSRDLNPPSIMLILYGPMAGISVGKMFMAAIPSGLTLSGLYIAYIVIRCWIDPTLCPVPSKEEKKDIPLAEKMWMLLTTFVPPAILIGSVLGSIFFGVATPTEAAGVGATASLFLAAGTEA